MALSMNGASTSEDLVRAAPHGHYWQQLAFQKNPRTLPTVIGKAEKSGFKALVLTVDLPVLGKRKWEAREDPKHL